MLRRFIWLMPLTLGLFALPTQALPTSSQITTLAQRICELPRQSSEKEYEEAVAQGLGGWLHQGSLTFDDLNNKDTMEIITNKLVGQMTETCPLRVMEINNELSNQTYR